MFLDVILHSSAIPSFVDAFFALKRNVRVNFSGLHTCEVM